MAAAPAPTLDLATFAGKPPGSGANFRKLSARLAARGAKNPDRLAAWIGRRKYGKKKFGKLSAHGQSHSGTGPAMEFAMPTPRRLPVSSPSDLIVSREPTGGAKIRHRNGGMEIATLRNTDKGWIAAIDGRDLAPHTHQRGALAEAIGTWNRAAGTPQHRPAAAGEPLQPAPRQTPLMQAYGIPAVRALATPTIGASDGPRTTSAGSDGDSDSDGPSGLSAKGQQIYKKLKAKGFPDARAMAFAKRAQNFGSSK